MSVGRSLELRIAGVLGVAAEGEVVLGNGDGEIFLAIVELCVLVVHAIVLLLLEILGHHFLGNAPAHEVEVAFAFESLLQTHLGAECFACIILRPACGGIEANLIVGSILRGVVEVLDVCAVHSTLAHAVDELAGSVEVFAQFNQRLSNIERMAEVRNVPHLA